MVDIHSNALPGAIGFGAAGPASHLFQADTPATLVTSPIKRSLLWRSAHVVSIDIYFSICMLYIGARYSCEHVYRGLYHEI